MLTKRILQKVRQDYSSIAKEFDASRKRPWPEFSICLQQMQKHFHSIKNIKLLDIGCGNGRLFEFVFIRLGLRSAREPTRPAPLSASRISGIVSACGSHQCRSRRALAARKNLLIDYTGIDNNRKLIQQAKKNYPSARFRTGDILRLPYLPHSFDALWCIAVLHHIPTSKLQLSALKQMKKILAPKGLLVLTVWNLWQEKYKNHIDPKTNDAEIPWGSPPKAKRFYHAFTNKELKLLLTRAGFTKLKLIKSEHNLVYICTK